MYVNLYNKIQRGWCFMSVVHKFISLLIMPLLCIVANSSCSYLDDADIKRAPPQEDLAIQRERERRGVYDPEAEEQTFLKGLFDNVTGSSDKGLTGIGVNTFLWRATLDRLSFMPLESADPFGGVIITDWYANSETSKEKFKIVAYIIGKELKVNAIKVSVFKKIKNDNDEWVDKKTNEVLSHKIEDAILTSARKYKIENID